MRAKPSWIMVRGRRAGGCVLAVTGASENVQRVAEEIADGGYDCFGATAAAVTEVFAMARFDVVLLLADLVPADRAKVAALHATHRHQTGILVHLMPAGNVDFTEIIAGRLRNSPLRRTNGPRGCAISSWRPSCFPSPPLAAVFVRVAALITDGGSVAAHASLVAREHGTPALVAPATRPAGCATARSSLSTPAPASSSSSGENRALSSAGARRYPVLVPTAPQLQAFLARPWARLRALKDRHHSERIAASGADEAFRIAALLRAHATTMGAIESDTARRADLLAAVSLRKLLDRAGRRPRSAR